MSMTKSPPNLAHGLQKSQTCIRCPEIIASLVQMPNLESRLRYNECAVVLDLLDQELQVDLRAARLRSRGENHEQSNHYLLSFKFL